MTVAGRGKEKAKSVSMVSLMMVPIALAIMTPSPLLASSQRTIEFLTMFELREPVAQYLDASYNEPAETLIADPP